MMLDYSCISLNGDSDTNEDRIGIFSTESMQCFVLADGLGGHGSGELASTVAVDYIKNYLLNAIYVDRNIIKQSIIGAHNQIKDIQQKNHIIGGMKTTVVLLVITPDSAYCAHVGDSRLYAFRHGKISFLTKDHSVPQMLVDFGKLSLKEIRNSPDRNRLLRAVGMSEDIVKVDVSVIPSGCKKGTSYLLCSDGFWEYISESEMVLDCLFSSKSETWLKKMERTVEKRGRGQKMDNYSAITVKCK